MVVGGAHRAMLPNIHHMLLRLTPHFLQDPLDICGMLSHDAGRLPMLALVRAFLVLPLRKNIVQFLAR